MDKYIGTLLGGRYEIVEVIGVGGMAIVYKAHCTVLNRYVAIKILKDEYAQDEEFRRRFYNESQAVAKLSHNNIVSVYDVAHSDGIDYIVMELIEGITLKEYLQKKGRLSWQETLFFTQQIARALEHAHGRGIIHQDIKPHNVLILRDGTAKVTDFGIARLENSQETRVIQEAIGSVHYISPEQAKGSTIDSRTDIYSLGVVMYECLTGKLPFEGDTALSIVMQHINAVPLMPSEIIAGIPKGMDDIVMHAMCPNASKRYSSAEELYSDLERLKANSNTNFGYAAHDVRGEAPLLEETQAIPDYSQRPSSQSFEESRISEPASRRSPSAPRRPKKRTLWEKLSESPAAMAGIAVLIFAIIALSVGAFLLFSGSGDQSKIEVPNFVGEDLDDILNNDSYSDFELEVSSEQKYDPAYSEGQIVDQDPMPNSKVVKGARVVLVLWGENQQTIPEDDFELPDYSDKLAQTVQDSLERRDIKVVIEEEASDEYESGYIIRTDPVEGSKVSAGETVTLYVSTGKETIQVKMPNLIGKTEADARNEIKQAGLKLGSATPEENEAAAGRVFYQSIDAGTKVPEQSVVNIKISLGSAEPDPGTTTPPEDDGTSSPPDDTNTPTPPAQTTDQGSGQIVVAVPSEGDSAQVRVALDGQTIYEQEVSTASKTLTIPIRGKAGTRLVEVYINGELFSSQELILD